MSYTLAHVTSPEASNEATHWLMWHLTWG